MRQDGMIDTVLDLHSVTSPKAESGNLSIEAMLRQGSAATVYLARRRGVDDNDEGSTSKHVILKVLNASESAETDLSLLKKESETMGELQSHPNVVGFFGLSWLANGIDDKNVSLPCWAMQVEYCVGGDLHDRAVAQRFKEKHMRDVTQKVFGGLCHMHKRGYLHRDLKPENVLWADGAVKIADFGICCHISNKQEMKRRCGSPGYIAPEMLLGHAYGLNFDCFSAGTLMYFLVSRRNAYCGPDVWKNHKPASQLSEIITS
jgi:serine/threonine protein kinase